MRSFRFDAALRDLGARFSERGGFVTPKDYCSIAVLHSDTAQEAEVLEQWLKMQMEL